MSPAEAVRKDGNAPERTWKDAIWTKSKGRHSAGIEVQPTVEVRSQVQATVKQPVSIRSTETGPEESKINKKRGNKLALKKFSISELADPALVEPPKALDPQETATWRSKSTTSLSNVTTRGSKTARSRSPPSGHQRTPSTNVSKPEKAIVTKSQDSPTKTTPSADQSNTQRHLSLAKVGRPFSTIFTRSASSPQISAPTVRKTKSIERLVNAISPANVPDLPTPSRLQKLQNGSTETIRKKDELWSEFRSLDQEHSKFINKPNSFKAQAIRQIVMPFLHKYADHASNSMLRIEDLDRRVSILNKWWLALLDMTSGRNAYAVNPSDRPILLDALTGIMQRPEWRQTTATLSHSRPATSGSSSFSRTNSGSQFLVESVLQNTNGMFVENLLAQMNFAVDRLSLRTVAASVVAFCGKAIAYAFLFCPGVADILVRLWNLPQGSLRRVLDEAGFPRNSNLSQASASVAHLFPSHIHHLCLRTLPALCRTLREGRNAPATLGQINWDGPWIGRWSGRDSDLFFSFTKHYHNLIFELLGDDCTETQRICAPGAVLVYGQILAVMDATISVHKHPSVPSQAVTFDDILEPNASATNLAVRGLNFTRSMAENRMIMLLRETLSDNNSVSPAIKISFAAIFGHLLKAATKRTSVHDADACFTLCDFLEESMSILARFFRNAQDPMAFLDWPFWLDVLKRMGESNNTMTEIRLYSLIFSLWGHITTDENKKRDLCLGWLLQEDYAYRQFNHWCPMVRAYYHRLLIWRVARCDGVASALDTEIFTTMLSLLQKLFSQYLHKLSTAQQEGTPIPSSTPSGPAPGRRLLIVRDDSILDPVSTMASLLAAATDHTTFQKLTSFESLTKLEESSEKTDSAKKNRFTFLRSLNPFQSAMTSSPPSLSTSPDNSPPSSTHTRGDSEGASTPESQSSRPCTPPDPIPDLVPNRSFKFSLEWVERAYPLRMDRKIFPPRLPHPAQTIVPKDMAEVIVLGDARPTKSEEPASRYVGVALAEWALLITEHTAFAERRRFEGVPVTRVETPMLGIEVFRKAVG